MAWERAQIVVGKGRRGRSVMQDFLKSCDSPALEKQFMDLDCCHIGATNRIKWRCFYSVYPTCTSTRRW